MKNDEELIKEVNKCSRCTLCLSVCPVYQAQKDEAKSAKGFLNIIYGFLTKKIKPDKKVDLKCLNCNKCQSFCPSNINLVDVLSGFKHNFKTSKYNPFLLQIKWCFFSFILKMYRVLKLNHFLKNSFLQTLSYQNVKIDKNLKKTPKNKKVVFFEGCFNRYINQNSKNSIINLLSKNGYQIVVPNFGCCNINSYFEGDFNEFEKSWKNKLKKIAKDTDFVLFDCDTCLKSFKIYADKFDKNLSLKALSFAEFANQAGLKIVENKKIKNIIYHKPCQSDNICENILKTQIPNLKDIENFEKCCGFGSLLGFENFELCKKIAKNKFNSVQINSDDTIVTSCNLCKIGLLLGLQENNIDNGAKVINISELFL